MVRHARIRSAWCGALALLLWGSSAHAAWMWDADSDKVDDRLEAVEAQGPLAARVGGLASGKLRFALVDGLAPYRYGVYVGYDHHPTDADAAALAALGVPVQVRYRAIDYIRSEVTAAQAFAIAQLPGVTRVETIPVMYAVNDNASRILRARPSSAAFPSVWKDLGITGKGVVVGIMDSGVNDAADGLYPGHESLRGKWVGGGTFWSGDPLLNTPIDQSVNPTHAIDPEATYHGTHVAGTAIGSGGPNGILGGMEPGAFAGLAPDARLVDLKVLSDAGTGLGSADGLDWAVAHRFDDWGLTGADTIYSGIQVLNMSLGGTDNSDGTDANSAAVNAAHKAGLVVCVATGNDGNTGHMAAPSAADFALSVGSFADGNTLERADDKVSSFSNEGPRLPDTDNDQFDEMKPSVLGSGTGILSALGDVTSDGNLYHHINGTSMSTPTVAGVCALMLQANPSLTPDQVRQILQNTSDHRTDQGKQPAGAADPFGLDPNYHPSWGWGEVDAYAAVLEAMNNSTTQVVRIAATPLRGPDRIRVDWVSQREVSLVRYEIQRAPDQLGVPGTWSDVTQVAVTEQHPEIVRLPNRHAYSWTDSSPLDPDATYWYRVRWLDFHGRRHAEPPISARISESPVVARVRYSWTHDYSDGDVSVRYGTGTNIATPVWQRYGLGAPGADSVVVVPGEATLGTKRHYFHVDLTAVDLVSGFLPPSSANPWFLAVKEGGYLDTKGFVNDFAVDVFDGPVTTTYAAPNLITPTIEKQETVFWIPLDPVTALNHAPAFVPVGPRSVAEGIAMGFQVSAQDGDGHTLAYSATGLPSGATFNTTTRQFAWQPGHTQAGTHDVSFHVSDGQFPTPATDTEVVRITVADRAPGSNLAPVLEPLSDRQALTGERLSLRIMARDPENGLVTFSTVNALPANSSLDPSTGLFTWTPSYDQVGTFAFTFLVTDAGSLSDAGEMLVTVSRAGVGPAPPLACEEQVGHADAVIGPGMDPGDKSVSFVGFDVPLNVQRIEGQLSFALAPVRDLDFYLLDADSNVVASSASIDQPESIVFNSPVPGHYIWKVVAFTNPDTAHLAIDQQVCIAATNAVGATTPGLRFAPATPNPFRGRTTLRWSLPESGPVRLRVFDVAGRHVRTLREEVMWPGEHSVVWDQRDHAGRVVSAGLYFVRFEAAGSSLGQKLILIP